MASVSALVAVWRKLAISGLRREQMVNQFPYEAALVVKSHLARTIQREFGSGSPEGDAMQPTFDMQVLFRWCFFCSLCVMFDRVKPFGRRVFI